MTRRILLRGGLVLRPGDEPAVLDGADVYVEGQRIVAVGESGERFDPGTADETVDARGLVVLPGFVNAHAHTPLSYLRGVAQDVDLGGFFGRMGPYAHLVRKEDAYWTVLLALAEMIRAGVTTCLDMFEWMDEAGRAFMDSGLRGRLACEFAGCAPAERGTRGLGFTIGAGRLRLDDAYGRRRLEQAEAEVAAIRALKCDRVTPLLGPHALYSCSPELLAETAALAERLGLSVTIHLAEHRPLERQIRRRYGSTVAVLRQTGLLCQPLLGIHCIYFTPAELEQLGAERFAVAHCPGSNLKLGERLAPVAHFLAHGQTVGLGTDSVMSNDNLDILEEARLAALAHKGEARQAAMLAGDTALQMATCLGAEAVGLRGEVGRLRPGYRADLMLMDGSGPQWLPGHAPLMALLYAASAREVRSVMVDGAWVMREGVIETFDEAEVLRRAREAARRPPPVS